MTLARTLLKDFDEIWNGRKVLQEVTDEVIDIITASYNENSPAFIYFVTLYNIFNEFLEDIPKMFCPIKQQDSKTVKYGECCITFKKTLLLQL